MFSNQLLKKLIVKIIIVGVMLILGSQTTVASPVSSLDDAFKLFPQQISKTGKYIGPESRQPSDFKYQIKVKGDNLIYKADCSVSRRKSVLNRSLQLQKTKMEFTEDEQQAAKRLGYTKRVSYFNQQQKQLVVALYQGSEKKKRFQVDYEEQIIDIDNLFVYLQAFLLQGVRDDFTTRLLVNDKGRTVKVKFKLHKTNQFQQFTDGYQLPDGLLQLAETKNQFYIFEMEVIGMAGLFWKPKYYCVYKVTSPYSFVAYWGGKQGRKEFIYCNLD